MKHKLVISGCKCVLTVYWSNIHQMDGEMITYAVHRNTVCSNKALQMRHRMLVLFYSKVLSESML